MTSSTAPSTAEPPPSPSPSPSPSLSPSPRLPVAIWVFGFVSLLMDTASEMIHGLLPAFLVASAGLSIAAVGLLDGVAEATALVVKVFSGALSDALGRRKPLAVIGYGLSALSKPLFALHGLGFVVSARIVDRIGKGIRGAPRDALLTEIAPPSMRGAAFGLRQSLDSVGALLGPLVAIALMWALHDDIRTVFVIAAIPGLLSVLLLVVAIKEPAQDASTRRPIEMVGKVPHPPLGTSPRRQAAEPASLRGSIRWPLRAAELRAMPASYWGVIVLAACFMLARISEGFLVLRAQEQGLALGLVPLVLVGMNIAYAASAWPAGRLADRLPRSRLLVVSLVVLLVGDLVLTQGGLWSIAGGVALWGLHMGLSQGVLSAMVADAAPAHLRGTAFGLFHLVSGAALLVSSTMAGLVWERFGPAATFLFGAAAVAVTIVVVAVRGPSPVARQ